MTQPTSRARIGVIASALALAVMQSHPSPADPMDRGIPIDGKLHHACGPDTAVTGLWDHCGEFPTGLPIAWRTNAAGAPASIAADFEDAVAAAAAAWALPGEDSVMRVAGTTTAGKFKDGVSSISWGDPAACGAGGARAVACLWFGGPNGAARHTILETDIILNKAFDWFQADAFEDAVGVAIGTAGLTDFNDEIGTSNALDLQSVLTHEMGHALGLEDLGGEPAWPTRAGDAAAHVQTMYGWGYAGATHARTLDLGDLLGLRYVTEHLSEDP